MEKATVEKVAMEISLDQETRATANSSGKGVAEIKPAKAGRIYLLANRGVYFSSFFRIIFNNLFLDRWSSSPATEIRIKRKMKRLEIIAPNVAIEPASQKFCNGDKIRREDTEMAVVKP